MGLLLRLGAWGLGVIAVVIAAFIVYDAFFGDGEPALVAAAPPICPPTLSVPPRPPGAPADDIVGLRPGFTVADVQAVLRCRDPHFAFDFEPIWHTPVPASVKSRQRMVATRPQERISLGLVGQPGNEIAYAIFQDVQYSETATTVPPDATAATLTRHYGEPHDRHVSDSQIDLWWLYGADGKPIKPPAGANVDPFSAFAGWVAGSWNAANCERQISLSPIAPARWSDQCGLTIHAEIEIRKEDHTRIARFRVVVEDQARLGAAVENYRERIGVKSPAQ